MCVVYVCVAQVTLVAFLLMDGICSWPRGLWNKPAKTLAALHIPVAEEGGDVQHLTHHCRGASFGKGDVHP